MSGNVGIFHRDHRPADAARVRRLMAAAPHRGPDATHVWTDRAIAIGHQWRQTAPAERPSMQWRVDPRERVAVSLDGTLHNRRELERACAEHLHGDEPGDADLVLASYRQWGDRCTEHLVGDFALVVYDGPRERVYVARDTCGVKPFLYALTRERFVWGSDLRHVLAAGVDETPNEGFIAEHLAGAVTSRTETLYRGVARLPAGHWMTVSSDRVDIQRYWSPYAIGEADPMTDGEHAARFLAVFREAVACRLDAGGRVAAYLSGGLDSSSVVGMACALGRHVESFSLVFDIPDADERRYIDAVSAKCDLTEHRLDAGAVDGRLAVERAAQRADVLDMPSDLLGERLLDRVAAAGFHTVLTGAAGDYGLAGSFYHYADLARERDWRGLVRQLRADRRMDDVSWSPQLLLSHGVIPFLPAFARRAARPFARALGLGGGAPDWIDPRLMARTNLADRLRGRGPRRTTSHARREVCDVFESGLVAWFLESKERAAAEHGIEERHPFFDRRLVELVIGLPERQRWRGEVTKYVLRHALRDLLPDPVYARTDKADFTACAAAAIVAVVEGQSRHEVDIDRLQIAEEGWVVQERVSAMYRDLRRLAGAGDPRYCSLIFPLWHVLGVEHWHRGRAGEAHQDAGKRKREPECRREELAVGRAAAL